ncbi:EcsC family protein [Gordoniibacillus kamchatkensis]|uniref:EcsC family protein n=1 Tax=Gordoniibacillus kamchatkensis TaxID=1590651 RepID=UPI000AF876F5|nr:EcsC family protein [Paenibacillus sp. VKM B-2647]
MRHRRAGLREWEKKIQTKVNDLLPDKWHQSVTAAVKAIVRTALFSMDYIPKTKPLRAESLADHDIRAEETLKLYRRIATVEGAGTGAGGIVLGLADFPILIGIKLKFLFELAHAYGYSTDDYRERLYLLHVFQLAFSSSERRAAIWEKLKRWNAAADLVPAGLATDQDQVDWMQLQQEYRDTIDFRKMLQLVPGIGAAVGAWANYGLLEELGEVGMNCYRYRWLQDKTKREGTVSIDER